MTIEYKSVMLWLVKTSHFISRKMFVGYLKHYLVPLIGHADWQHRTFILP
jgi:hypothetical protein